MRKRVQTTTTIDEREERTDYVPPLWVASIKLNSIFSAQITPYLPFMTQSSVITLTSNCTVSLTNFVPFFFRILRDNCCKNFVNCVPIVGTSSKKERKIKSEFTKWPEAFFCDIQFVMRINELFFWKVLTKYFGNFEIKYAFLIHILTLWKLHKPFNGYAISSEWIHYFTLHNTWNAALYSSFHEIKHNFNLFSLCFFF